MKLKNKEGKKHRLSLWHRAHAADEETEAQGGAAPQRYPARKGWSWASNPGMSGLRSILGAIGQVFLKPDGYYYSRQDSPSPIAGQLPSLALAWILRVPFPFLKVMGTTQSLLTHFQMSLLEANSR